MTPLVVIDRYLDAAGMEPFDVERFVRLLGCDADLLGRWLLLLGAEASPAALGTRLANLGPAQFPELAISQALAVLTTSGGTRMGMARWQTALTSSWLAQTLAEAHDLPEPDAVRWRVLLGLAGVNLPADSVLTELQSFRGARLELLEDADPILRIFAIADALDTYDPAPAQQAAVTLLAMQPVAFQACLRRAEARALDVMQRLDLDLDEDLELAESLWVRLRIGLLGRLIADAPSGTAGWPELAMLHAGLGRMLFGTEPRLLLLDPAGNTLCPVDGHGPRIALDSATSLIARCARLGERIEFYDQVDAAVADRQLLRQLHADAAVCLPVRAGPGARVEGILLVALDEEDGIEDERGLALYARELARRVAQGLAGATEVPDALDRFRQREERRLRELVHEVNNPLSIVQNYLHILQHSLSDRPKAVDQLQLIAGELRRIGGLLGQVRQVPDPAEALAEPTPAPADVALGALVRRLVEMHQGHAAAHSATLTALLPAHEVRIVSDEQRIAQVLTNLLRNALEADRGHAVRVELLEGAYRDARPGILLVVADSGPGLPAEVLGRLGVPQQSAKGGEHAGLGLAIVHRLVTELGGSLDVRSVPGQGATFSVFLPNRA